MTIEVVNVQTALVSGCLVRRVAKAKGLAVSHDESLKISNTVREVMACGFSLTESIDGAIRHHLKLFGPHDS